MSSKTPTDEVPHLPDEDSGSSSDMDISDGEHTADVQMDSAVNVQPPTPPPPPSTPPSDELPDALTTMIRAMLNPHELEILDNDEIPTRLPSPVFVASDAVATVDEEDSNDEDNGEEEGVAVEMDSHTIVTQLIGCLAAITANLGSEELPSASVVREATALSLYLASRGGSPYLLGLYRRLRALNRTSMLLAHITHNQGRTEERMSAAFERVYGDETISADMRTSLVEAVIPTLSDDIDQYAFRISVLREELSSQQLELQSARQVLTRFIAPAQVVLQDGAFDDCTTPVQETTEEATCPICLCDLTDNTVAVRRINTCGHLGCEDCMRLLLTKKCRRPVCPICRADVRAGCAEKTEAELSRQIPHAVPVATPPPEHTPVGPADTPDDIPSAVARTDYIPVPRTPPIEENPDLSAMSVVREITFEGETEEEITDAVRSILSMIQTNFETDV